MPVQRKYKICPFLQDLKFVRRIPYRYWPNSFRNKGKDRIIHRSFKRGIKNYVKQEITNQLKEINTVI